MENAKLPVPKIPTVENLTFLIQIIVLSVIEASFPWVGNVGSKILFVKQSIRQTETAKLVGKGTFCKQETVLCSKIWRKG